MHVADDALLLSADHQRDLAVSLQPHQSVDDMTSGLLQLLGPDDVVLLVKPRLQLHQHRHLLAVLSGSGQRGDNRRIAADPVQCLLDGQHLLILRSLLDEIHHRIESLVRMMEENISLLDLREDILSRRDSGIALGHIGLLAQILAACQAVHLHKEGKVDGTVDSVDIHLLNLEVFFQDLQKAFVYLVLDLQTDDLSPLALGQLFLDLLEKIRCLILVKGEVGVSHNTVGIGADHIVVQEEFIQILLDDLLQKQEGVALILLRRDRHQTGQARRNLDRGKLQLILLALSLQQPGAVILSADQSGDIQRLVADQRKRPGRIHSHRRQYRIYLLGKIAVHINALLLIQILVSSDQTDSLFLHNRQKGAIKHGILLIHQFSGTLVNCLQLLCRSKTSQILFRVTGILHILQRSYTNHEKLIQVRGSDADKFQPLQYRKILVSGFIQNPLVKLQPAQLPVLKIFRIPEFTFFLHVLPPTKISCVHGSADEWRRSPRKSPLFLQTVPFPKQWNHWIPPQCPASPCARTF